MKTNLFLIFATLIISSCQMQSGYKVKVHVSDLSEGKVYLMREIEKKPTAIDSAELVKGGAVFTGKVESPELYYIKLNQQRNLLRLFIENSTIEVTMVSDSVDKAMVMGSATHDIYKPFAMKIAELDSEQRALSADYQALKTAGNSDEMKKIEDQVSEIYNRQQSFTKEFVNANTESVVGLYIIRWYLIYELDYLGLSELLSKVSAKIQNTPIYNVLNDRMGLLERTQTGKPAIDFSMESPDGNLISLSSFKGKYLLVDFWASWCGPCRRANPHVVDLYKKYNKMGFEILGVSLDNNKDKWLEAIKIDNLTWPHVSDLKGWQNSAGQLYGVNSIPHTVLIDNDGIIIGSRLSHEDLESKLAEIFKGK
jgi:thiol-disulfide isomerase/thioredoxin/phage tail tube protein FII